MELKGHTPNYTGKFGDKRLADRAQKLSNALLMAKTSSIHGSTKDEAEQKGFYRFLSNENVTELELIKELNERCASNTANRDIIIIQDSTSIGLSSHANHIKPGSGLGLVGNKKGLGFLSHVSIAIAADTEAVLGFADVQLWHRTQDKANNSTKLYKRQPIEEKESYKWIKAGQQAQQCLAAAKTITIIQDREGDIYEQFCLIPDDRTQLIIRSRDNRKLSNGAKLYEQLSACSVGGSYEIEIAGDIRKNKVARKAAVKVRWMPVSIQKPKLVKNKSLPEEITIYAIEVSEEKGTSKQGICWRLLTTRPVNSYEDAISVINRYKQRWYIEQLFRLIKKQGYQIERTQLENGWAIRKLFVLVLNNALRVMQLYLAEENEESQLTCEVFSEEEINCLEVIEKKHVTVTANSRNPYPKERLAWASWIIARLGGWKGNAKQRRAGPILLKTGLDKFEFMFQGWKLAQSLI